MKERILELLAEATEAACDENWPLVLDTIRAIHVLLQAHDDKSKESIA